MTEARTLPSRRTDKNANRRTFVTPEGVDLKLDIASVSERAGAVMLDIIFIVLTLVAFTLLLLFTLSGSGPALGQILAMLWLLGFFALRNGYFAFFELGPRAATPGKRIMKLRVISRNGSRLRGHQVIARNAMRELELFLPLAFAASQSAQGLGSFATGLFGLIWTGLFALFPLFNRDRLRVGDLIAGTWVVRVPKRSLSHSVATSVAPEHARYTFSDAQLAVYGEFELQKLEEVIRRNEEYSMIVVARTIRERIGIIGVEGDEYAFLEAYYTALCQRLERGMLFGKRKKDKYQR
ncbi:RDD family protein [Sphingomonas sp. HITSZ_GF]|uniref:RDD family protein n=1 Tax=Sphingomonas sp. HITSZ_GF TaxID=3037247 RepID=UPI00240CFAEF|nr:RDD family protein [Sphingomonas sp. HITSZ_GF]MDG2532541.1 RDD family protein [Sphingomonas sp. HITSZ_GF]